MKKRLFYSLAIFPLLFAYSAQGQNFVKVNKTNSGQSIQLGQDQVLEVQLPKRPSNGYTWVESTSSTGKLIQRSVVQIGDAEFIHDATSGKLKGGTGTQIIRYAGISQGTTILTLELRRPWEMNSPAIDNFTITIVSGGKYTGTYKPPVKDFNTTHKTSTPAGYPSKFDWRSQCTPVTDQQSCGDCWAFAGVGVFECDINIIDGVTRDISEEWMTDCYTGNGCSGCNGGSNPQDAWLSPTGAVYETDDPWTTSEGSGTTGTCGTSYTYHETITSHANVPGCSDTSLVCAPDSNIKKYMYNYGPIFTYVDASNWSGSYSGAIWTETGSSNTDHCVVIVGWVDSSTVSGGGYWIVRNSWGPSWGNAGYMYASYGTDFLGQGADYLVYKGGIPHNAPPVVNFSASSTSSCTGTIQFSDASSNLPTSWLWTFGDGNSSTVQNPSHTYTASGTYTVNLTATNSYGDSSLTKTNYITINLPTSPTTTGASTTAGGSVTLHASGADTLKWYDAATGGNLVNTGTSYTISPLTSTETFYVESDVTQSSVSSVGIMDSTTSGSNYTGSSRRGLVFNADVPLTLDSVTVYEGTSGSRTIWLKNSSGTYLDSLVTTVATGKHKIALNFSVPAGTGYILGAASASNFWRETSGVSYPYTVPNVISITGNTASNSSYYFFYDWIITHATTCISARVPVIATVSAGIDEFSENDFELFPNPNSGSFDITLNNNNFQVETISIINVLGDKLFEKKITDNNPVHIDASGLQEGIYFVELKTAKSIYLRKIAITK